AARRAFANYLGIAHQNDVACPALDPLKLDGLGPHLLLPDHVVENTAVASLVLSRRVRRLAPLELGAQVVVVVFLLGDEVAVLRARGADHSVLDREDLVGIIVQALLFKEGVKTVQVLAVEQLYG